MISETGVSYCGIVLVAGIGVLLCVRGRELRLRFACAAIFFVVFFLLSITYGAYFPFSKKYFSRASISISAFSKASIEIAMNDTYREANWLDELQNGNGSNASLLGAVLVILMVLAIVVGAAGKILFICMEPPYKVPRIRSLRDQLEDAHPTWYQ